MKYLSLFSGIGGFELGITQAYESKRADQEQESNAEGVRPNGDKSNGEGSVGYEWQQNPSCVGFSEIDKYATQIYQKHFPEHKNYGDITKINAEEIPDFDLLVGGFPCQAFSIAGKRAGFSDTRGTLFFEIARILQSKKPRLFLLENVKGLLSHDNGKTFSTIISTLDELGYDLQWQVLNSKNFGVPQNRERVFIVGHLRGTSRPEVFPFGSSNEGVGKEQLYGQETTGQKRNMRDIKYWWRPEMRIRKLTPTECERLQGFPDGWTEYAYCPACHLEEAGGLVHSMVHNDIHSKLKISDTQRYKCLGNAVTVNVIEAIVDKLLH